MFQKQIKIGQQFLFSHSLMKMKMSTKESQHVEFIQKTKLNHDSYMFRFNLQSNTNPIEYKPGSHFVITGLQNNDGMTFKNKYTPMQPYEGQNYFDTLIKIYRPNTHPLYPEGGKLTPLLENLKEGDIVNIDGPLISIHYQGQGKFNIKRFKQKVEPEKTQIIEPKNILFIAGGTGIAPFYSMIQQIVKEGIDTMNVTLLFGNKTKNDIVLKEELDNFAKQNKNIKIVYTIDQVQENENWDGEVGIINKDLISKYISEPNNNGTNYVMICGNTPMNKSCLKIISDIGFDPYHYFRF